MATPDTTLKRLRDLLSDQDLSEHEAVNLLGRIQRRESDIPDAEVYGLLQEINVRQMGERPHRGHAKVADRSLGRRLRVKRTGSRRG